MRHSTDQCDRPPVFLEKYIDAMDVLIINSAHHWNKGKMVANKWVYYMDGQPLANSEEYAMDELRRLALTKTIAWLDDRIMHNHTKAKVYMRSLSPRHFSGGEWDTGGRCDNNVFPLDQTNISSQVLLVDRIAEDALRGSRIRLLNITYISAFRDDAHIAKYKKDDQHQDCLHWCLPGPIDTWNAMLLKMLSTY